MAVTFLLLMHIDSCLELAYVVTLTQLQLTKSCVCAFLLFLKEKWGIQCKQNEWSDVSR